LQWRREFATPPTGDFQVYLRLLKKKIITVVLDTDHEVHFRPVTKRAGCATRTRPGLQKWKTPEARKSESCSLTPVTDFYGA
jgi:hypothetical protein